MEVSDDHFCQNGGCQPPKDAYSGPPPMMAKPKRPPNIDQLITRAKEGDKAARYELLVWAHKYLRWKAADPKLRTPTGKSDVGQDAVERVLGGLDSFRGSTGMQFEAWLRKIVTTRVVELHRGAGREKRDVRLQVPIDDVDPDKLHAAQKSPSQTASDHEIYVDLYAAIFQLPVDQQRAVVLTQLNGNTIAEAAEEIGKTPTVVAGLLQRGIHAVRATFSGQNESRNDSVTRALRKKWTLALLEYSRLRDARQAVDIDTFVATHAPGDEHLKSLLVWMQRIRESGDGNGGGKE